MTPIERAYKLKQEADDLLQKIDLATLCRPIGEMTATGSYFLDLMMYPDIDLYLPPATPTQLFKIVSQLAENHPVIRVNYEKGGRGPLASALYIKPVIAVGNWERPWKIDIWAVDTAYIQAKTAELQTLANKMSPHQRNLILEYKYSVLNDKGRTPTFSGIYIYQAIIEQGMEDFDDITQFLRANAITM